MHETDFDLVLPCYNPPAGWAQNCINRFRKLSAQLPDAAIGLTIVNDGSGKGIAAADIALLKNSIPGLAWVDSSPNKGKGHALRMGVAHTSSPLCIYTDIDFPYTTESLLKVYGCLKNREADIAIGVKDGAYYDKVPKGRVLVSKTLRRLSGLLLRIPITDTQCGLKGFNQKGRAVFLQTETNRYLFDLEFVYLASKSAGISMLPVEVHLRDGVVFSKMDWKTLIREGWNFLKILFKR